MQIPTTLQSAGPAKRLKAFLFDYLVIVAYAVVLVAITFGVVTISNSLGRSVTWPDDPLRADLLAFVTLVLPVILYFTLQESSPRQATWGKRKAGIRVINSDGGRLAKTQAFVRSALKFLPWQIAHTSLFHIEGWPSAPADPTPLVIAGFVLVWVIVAAYVGMLLVSKDHRTPYDWAAGAHVIVTP
jgi:uncharacterized RDD family membrane protein YckC